MGISSRLKHIAEKVTAGYIVADIGTDHGYVPIYLLKNGISPRVIASDLSCGSLRKAQENAIRYNVSEYMECRLSDGFAAFSAGEVQCAIISGMGGILIVKILSAHLDVTCSLKEIILSPHRDIELVKDYLQLINFSIISEEYITDKKKNYCIIKAINMV